jgi:hypothetical protein
MFDAAKLIEAARAASQAKPVPVTIPGIGKAFRRKLTVADIDEASVVREKLEEKGNLNRNMSMAVGLAQVICGPDGESVFDIHSEDHLKLLASLPWESVRSLMVEEGNG